MKASDLMIGDWLLDENDNSFQVATIKGESGVIYDEYNDFRTDEDVKPIRITYDILLRNGFEKVGFKFVLTIEGDELNTYIELVRYECSETFCCKVDNFPIDVRVSVDYVHELQHVFKMCKIEKEIQL